MSDFELVGVYNANGGFSGEVAYVLGKLSGSTHCALCDITHGMNPLGKPAWKRAANCLSAPIRLVHLNEMDPRTEKIINQTSTPAVVLLSERGDRLLINSSELENCHGEPEKLVALIEEKLGAWR